MNGPFAYLRSRSLGLRMTIALVAAAATLTALVGVATVSTVKRSLEDARIRSATRQTVIAVLFAREFLGTSPSPTSEDLVAKLQIRQRFDAMLTEGDQWFSTSLDLNPTRVPEGLRGLVREETLGYQIVARDSQRELVFGSPLPPDGIDLYLFFPLAEIDRTISVLGRAISGVGLLAVLGMALLARRLSRGILHPLAAVGDAAQRMAGGLLETRVEPSSSDELGQLAASFNQMAEALHGMIRHERDFVAAVSHELRTPLAALHAAAEVVGAHREELPPDGREALDLIREDLASLAGLVTELLEVSELDSGRATVRVESFDLRAFVTTLLSRKRMEARLDAEEMVVSTDKARLERIVGNLLDNAVTHGGAQDVAVSIAQDSSGFRIEVADGGPGIAPEDLPLLFGRFYKPDTSRSRHRGGVGLGLAIAQENARLLGGAIEVHSELGVGARFVVSLPRMEVPA